MNVTPGRKRSKAQGGGVCQSPNPGMSLGGSFSLLQKILMMGDTHGFPWRACRTPWAIGSRVALGKNNPRNGDLGVERGDEAPESQVVTAGAGASSGHGLGRGWVVPGDPGAGTESVTPPFTLQHPTFQHY